MNKKIILVLVLLVVAVLGGGCGETGTESSIYYYPTWSPDGRIIAEKDVYTTKSSIFGKYDSSIKSYIVAMSSDGTNEVNLFEIGDMAYPTEMACSPNGKKIGYISNPDYGITICNYDGTGKTKIPGITNARYFDWSPDSQKVAYSTLYTKELRISGIDGTNNTQLTTSAESVAWRVGDRIVYEYFENGQLYLGRIKVDGTLRESFGDKSLYSPQISTSDYNTIYGVVISSYRKIDTSDPIIPEEVLIPAIDFINPRLSYDNKKIVGGDLDQQAIVGIYIVDIDGTNSKRLR